MRAGKEVRVSVGVEHDDCWGVGDAFRVVVDDGLDCGTECFAYLVHGMDCACIKLWVQVAFTDNCTDGVQLEPLSSKNGPGGVGHESVKVGNGTPFPVDDGEKFTSDATFSILVIHRLWSFLFVGVVVNGPFEPILVICFAVVSEALLLE